MRYKLFHFTVNEDGSEPEDNSSIGEFVITEHEGHRFELVFVYTHNSHVQNYNWMLPSRLECEDKIKHHLAQYFKSWEVIEPTAPR
jgi:hypothetical protein